MRRILAQTPVLLFLCLYGIFIFAIGQRLDGLETSIAFVTAGSILVLVTFAILLGRAGRMIGNWARIRAFKSLVQAEDTICFLADANMIVASENVSKSRRKHKFVADYFSKILARPHYKLSTIQQNAAIKGNAQETIQTGRFLLRFKVTALDETLYLWRVEKSAVQHDKASSEAIVRFTVEPGGNILSVSDAWDRYFLSHQRRLAEVFNGKPSNDRVQKVKSRAGTIDAFVFQFDQVDGNREFLIVPDAANILSETSVAWNTLSSLPIPILEMSVDGTITEINTSAQSLVDGAKVGQNLATLLEGPGRAFENWVQEFCNGHQTSDSQFLRRLGRNSNRFVQATLFRTNTANSDRILVVIWDAGAAPSQEAKLVQSQKMSALGQLAGGIAHDLNNSLTAILGHCDLSQAGENLSKDHQSDIQEIRENAARAALLVDKVLAFSRRQNLSTASSRLLDLIVGTLPKLNSMLRDGQTIKVEQKGSSINVLIDERKFQHMFEGLIANAIDAMQSEGEITISFEEVDLMTATSIGDVLVPTGKYARIDILDRGTGFTDSELSHVFEPFFTTKTQSSRIGLGLATAYGFVKQSGGYIFADNREDGPGARLTIFLPTRANTDSIPQPKLKVVASNGLPSSRPRVTKTKTSEANAVVLVVEDECAVRRMTGHALRMQNFTVLEADSGEMALAILEDTTEEINAVVSDVLLPGLNGPEWVQKAKETHPGLPVIFVSGFAQDAFIQQNQTEPDSLFLPKPYSINDLIQKVRTMIAERAVVAQACQNGKACSEM